MSTKADLDDALVSNTDRHLTVVARVSRADPSALADKPESERIQTLKEHAARTQRPVLRFAERRDGVSVRKQFWLVNAVTLDVDTDRVSLDDVARISGVERLHANFELEAHGVDAGDEQQTETAE